MALSKEQFQNLRDKGLTIDQIVRFEAGEVPQTQRNNSGVELWDTSGFEAGFTGIGKGLGKLALGVGTLGRGIQRAIIPKAFEERLMGSNSIFDVGSENRQKADEFLAAKNTGEKISSTITEIGAMAVPSGSVYKATKGLGFAARLLGRTGGGAVTGTIQGGGDIDKDTAIGAVVEGAFPVLGKASDLTSSFVKKVVKNAAAGISGKGTDVIETVLKNPQAAREGLREAVSRADDAATIRTSVSNLAKAASDQFKQSLDELPKRLGRSPKVLTEGGKTTIKVDGKKYELSLKGVKSLMTKSLRDFDVNVNPKKKAFDFSEAPLDTAEEKRLREVFRVIDSWKDTTPAGFHKLSRKIGNFRKPGEQSPELNSIIDRLSKNAHDYIAKRIPAAKSMLDDYSKAQDTIEVFNKEFATKGRFVGGTADRIGTEKKLGTLFSGEKTTGRNYLESVIPQGDNIPAREAGRLLGDDISRSGASIGDFLRMAVNTVISPKMIGELTALTGMAAPKAKVFLERLHTLDPAARSAVIETLTDLLGEGEQETQ